VSERRDGPDGPTTRRRFLWGLGATALAGFAGCTRSENATGPAAGGTSGGTIPPGSEATADQTPTTGSVVRRSDALTLAFGEPYETEHVTLRVDSVDLFDGFGVREYCRRDLTDSPVATATMTDGDRLARIVVSIRNVAGSALWVDLENFMASAGGELIAEDRFLGHSGKIEHPGANGLHDGEFGPSTATGQFGPVCFEVDGETRPNRDTEAAQYFDAGEEGTVWLYAVVPGDTSASDVAVGFERRGLYDVTPNGVSGPEETADPGPSAWWMADPPEERTGTAPKSTGTDSESTGTPSESDS